MEHAIKPNLSTAEFVEFLKVKIVIIVNFYFSR